MPSPRLEIQYCPSLRFDETQNKGILIYAAISPIADEWQKAGLGVVTNSQNALLQKRTQSRPKCGHAFSTPHIKLPTHPIFSSEISPTSDYIAKYIS